MSGPTRKRVLLRDPLRTARFVMATRTAARTPPILCASIGRVGSTLLWQAIIEGQARALLGSYEPSDWHRIAATCWDLAGARLAAGKVIKTHDLPYRLVRPRPLKVVFLFGRPSDIVLSVLRCQDRKGAAWVAEHLRHLHADGPLADAGCRDVLRIGEQVDAWLGVRDLDLLALRYDTLWDHRAALGDFLGFDVPLPPRVSRGFDDLDSATVALVRESHAALDARIAALPDITRIRRESEASC